MKNTAKKLPLSNLNLALLISVGVVTNVQAGFEMITEQSQEAHKFVSTGDNRNVTQNSVAVDSINEQYAQVALNAKEAERALGVKPTLKGEAKVKGAPNAIENIPNIDRKEDPVSTPNTLKVGENTFQDVPFFGGEDSSENLVFALRQLREPPTFKPTVVEAESNSSMFIQDGFPYIEGLSIIEIIRERRAKSAHQNEFTANLLLKEQAKEIAALNAQVAELQQKLAVYESGETKAIASSSKSHNKVTFAPKKRKNLAKAKQLPSSTVERVALQ